MRLNQLAKEKADKIQELEKMKNIITEEQRALTSDELKKCDELKKDIEILNGNIRMLEEETKNDFTKINALQDKNLGQRLSELGSGEVINAHELRAVGLSLGPTGDGDQASTPLGDTAKVSFADNIIESITHISGLFDAIHKETLTGAEKVVPFSKQRVGKFVGMKELSEYARNTADIDSVKLEPNKFGTIIGLSKELIEDYGYNIEGYICRELGDALGETLDELIIKGAVIEGKTLEGLDSFGNDDDYSHKLDLASEDVGIDEILKLYYKLPIKYRNKATWVINEALAEKFTALKDANGQPILVPNYHTTPFGTGYTLFGRPVIVNSYVGVDSRKVMFFGDLNRAILCGIRKHLELSRSTEAGFFTDEILIKASIRLDIKKLQTDSMAYAELPNTTGRAKSTTNS